MPECTPACSICCMMPQMTTLPSLSQRASTSNSSARSRYLSTSTGLSGSTSTALSMYLLRSLSLQRLFVFTRLNQEAKDAHPRRCWLALSSCTLCQHGLATWDSYFNQLGCRVSNLLLDWSVVRNMWNTHGRQHVIFYKQTVTFQSWEICWPCSIVLKGQSSL